MLTVAYSEILALAARLAGRPPDKLPVADAELLHDFIEDQLARLWTWEAWPELCNDFAAVTVANGQFAKNDATQGDVLSLYAGGNPQTTTNVTKLKDWVEGDGVVRVTTAELSGTLYVEYQDLVTPLPAYGNSGLAATALPARFKYPLARLAAADLIEDEDPAKASRLRGRAEDDLVSQASQFGPPWWRK